MASLMYKLGSNEAVLLMYLADELPAEDRAEVEQMLASDESLRRQLAGVGDLQASVTGRLDDVEIAKPARVDEAAVGRALREMRRYRLECAARPTVEVAVGRRWPKWSYPIAAAAAVVFVLIGLWGVGVVNFGPDVPNSSAVSPVAPDDDTLNQLALNEGWPFGPVGGTSLDEATRRADELQASDDDDGLLLML